ncbi:hypothetical protein [Flexistipes sp.]|uniref:hypothetical protein n=1 Tax=Flexistipes sp. TaxID=3088135 RepID=UPI002E1E9414|nr:hypothetical protein [Flexistipes sp.]
MTYCLKIGERYYLFLASSKQEAENIAYKINKIEKGINVSHLCSPPKEALDRLN